MTWRGTPAFAVAMALPAVAALGVYVINDESSFHRFVHEGWEFGADADAALMRDGDDGVAGTKYWKDGDLN